MPDAGMVTFCSETGGKGQHRLLKSLKPAAGAGTSVPLLGIVLVASILCTLGLPTPLSFTNCATLWCPRAGRGAGGLARPLLDNHPSRTCAEVRAQPCRTTSPGVSPLWWPCRGAPATRKVAPPVPSRISILVPIDPSPVQFYKGSSSPQAPTLVSPPEALGDGGEDPVLALQLGAPKHRAGGRGEVPAHIRCRA